MLRIGESALGFEQPNQVAEGFLFGDLRFRLDPEFFLDEVDKVHIDERFPAYYGVAAIRRLQGSWGHLEQVLDSGLEFKPSHEFNI